MSGPPRAIAVSPKPTKAKHSGQTQGGRSTGSSGGHSTDSKPAPASQSHGGNRGVLGLLSWMQQQMSAGLPNVKKTALYQTPPELCEYEGPHSVEVEVIVDEFRAPKAKPLKRPARPENVVFYEPISHEATLTYWAVPVTAITQTTQPASPGAPAIAETAAGSFNVIARTPEFFITNRYHKLAVGAGSTSVYSTSQGVVLVDAGVHATGRNVNMAIADATVQRLSQIVAGRPILEILFSHAHLDHTALAPRLARNFDVRSLRINAIQEASPVFRRIRREVAQSRNQFREKIATEVRAELAPTRASWERSQALVPETKVREARWSDYVERVVRQRLESIRPIDVNVMIPHKGKLHVVRTPIERPGIPQESGGSTTERTTRGLRESGRTAITDPNSERELARVRRGGRTRQLDPYSTSWVIDIGKIRLLILPDLRARDIKRILRSFQAAASRMGHAPTMRVWDIGHHLQSGFRAIPASQLGEFTRQLHLLRKFAGGGVGHDLVVVSARHDVVRSPRNPRAQSYIDPANVWLLESLGYRVIPAVKGQEVEVLEVLTARGRRVTGVVGPELGMPRPSGALLGRANAAIDQLSQEVRVLRRRLRQLKRTAPERQPLELQMEAKRVRAKAIKQQMQEYTETFVRKIGRTVRAEQRGEALPSSSVEPGAAEAAKLRAALEGFNRPVTSGSPHFTEAALVIMRHELAQGVSGDARQLLQARIRIGELRQQMSTSKVPHEVHVRFVSELAGYQGKLETLIKNETGSSREILIDELKSVKRVLRTHIEDVGGTRRLSRLTGTGELVETRVVVKQRIAGEKSVASQRVGAALKAGGRVFGGVMVIQTIKGQTELEKRLEQGKATGFELLAGTTHNALGVTLGTRMVVAKKVPGYGFVILSALDIAQTSARDYATEEQRNTEITYSVIRNGLSLALFGLSHLLIKTRHPAAMIAGAAIMFLADPILNALGVYDWLERSFSFLPSEVTGAKQDLRKLMQEYRVIVGMLDLAQRQSSELSKLGVKDTARFSKTIDKNINKYRVRARNKELQVLRGFEEAYKEASTSFAGLPVLDAWRAEFLRLQHRINPSGEGVKAWLRSRDKARRAVSEPFRISPKLPPSIPFIPLPPGIPPSLIFEVKDWVFPPNLRTIRKASEATFRRTESLIQLHDMSPKQINAMEQWSELDKYLDELHSLLGKDELDIEEIEKTEGKLARMLRNARYRLDPRAIGEHRQAPLVRPGSEEGIAYEKALRWCERRYASLQVEVLNTMVGRGTVHPYWGTRLRSKAEIDTVLNMLGSRPKYEDVDPYLPIFRVSTALSVYKGLIKAQPALPDELSPKQLHRSSAAMGTLYRNHIKNNDIYAFGLTRIERAERALRTLIREAKIEVGAIKWGSGPAAQSFEQPLTTLDRLAKDASWAIEQRREVHGFYFLWETAQQLASIREFENIELARLLMPKEAKGKKKGGKVKPLNPFEEAALRSVALGGEEKRVTTLVNRLRAIPELELPSIVDPKAKGNVGGIYRIVGKYGEFDILIISFGGRRVKKNENVLVGDTGDSYDTSRGAYGCTKMIRVVPLNDAAIKLLGGPQPKWVIRNILYPVSLEELRS